MRNKLKLTEKLVNQLPDQYKVTTKKARTSWWCNIRPNGGMRLTSLGCKVLIEQLNIKYYVYQIQDPFSINQKIILKMDRLLQEPYYIVTKQKMPTHILFFGSKEAMIINLYGDIAQYLDSH